MLFRYAILVLSIQACDCGSNTTIMLDAGVVDDAAADAQADSGLPDAGTDASLGDVSSPDAGVSCTPDERTCDGDIARVCVASGDAWNELECSTGCTDGRCEASSLEMGWLVHQYELSGGETVFASYVFEEDGLVAVQSANAMASVYYNDTELPEGVVVSGRFSVRTMEDDDFIGFVFGWQDPEHYYLLDWKQAGQDDPVCGLAETGATLKVVQSETTPDACMDFWQSSGTDRVSPIVESAGNPNGWEDNTDYDLLLTYFPGEIHIVITKVEGAEVVVDITSSDTTFASGKFGFFNYSQESVRYEFFSFSPI